MAYYKTFPIQDATLYSSYPEMNTGLDAICEASNIFGIGGDPGVSRFLTLFDAKVNIKIIREADGFVSYLDCMNIKNFCLSNTILFIYKLNFLDLNKLLDQFLWILLEL